MIPSLQTMAPRNSILHPLLPLLLLSFSIICISVPISSASNLLTINQTLSGDQKLTSKGENFVLGFFTPTNTSNTSSKFYIGIWYFKVSKLKPVWVANRDTPVSDTNSSVLQISQDGNLVLLDQDKSLIWSTNATISYNSTVAAVLGDDGNLVLRDLYNSSKVFWQSIENPADTWLPGGKIAFNRTAGVSQKLISWKNSENPAPGIFSMEIDPVESQYLLKWNGTKTYWNTGSWNGHIFSGVPEMRDSYIYDFDFINNSQESYFNYSLKGGTTIISRFIMDVSGQIKMLNWVDYNKEWTQFWAQPKTQCQVIRLCGPFGTCNEEKGQYCSCLRGFSPKSPEDWALSDYSGGCSRDVQLQCGGNSSTNYVEPDKFLQISSVRLPEDIGQSLQVGSSAADCEQACLSDCSCTAYSYSNNCSLWYGELLDLQEQYSGPDRGGTLYLRLAASELPSNKGKKRTVLVFGVVVGVVAACLACVAVLIWILVWRRRRRQLSTASKLVEGTLVAFRYSDLQRVTKNFSDQLGVGGFGSVFKGVLPDSTVIAVKKLAGIGQGEKQFRTEVSTIGTVQHVNLVRLRGFCSENTQRLLVYDHMPNGSLDAHLFQNIPNHVLSWSTRYNIALGIARGLVYLHEKCRDCIIHCDIKPENILLDDSFAPKVSDFGLAKLVGRDFSRVLTTMRGTRGYLAPEWISGVPITPKADAYSYGMMLFEIISGRRNTEQLEEKEGPAVFFPKVAARKLIEGEVVSLLDPRLEGVGSEEEISRVCKVAFWCVQDDEFFRPTMGQVVQILEGVLEVNMPPIPRSLEILSENEGSIVFFSDSSSNHSSQMKSTASNSSQTKSTSSSVSIHQE
ncbi:hypothetical protein J5N97_011833 [Dioscorea zingiberensis]|uniref:Receptor-like serine/threonine-protein kinase n=1 Tax=Dioscorea zingiberensis TaxID=325984 RepID=A0A9D5D1V4_9LILI|nr:hypothetical protein J5N97_011833 [Dioscorea zingiberensis]